MLQLRVFAHGTVIGDVAARLRMIEGARHVLVTNDGVSDGALVTADLVEDAVDKALRLAREAGVPSEDIVLLRVDSVGAAAASRPLATVVWADLLSQAGANARPLARYLVFMAAAGVIAAFGVIYANVVLIVGAMAISPDTLPVCAAATALVLRRFKLAGRAVVTLAAGLGLVGLVGAVLTFVLHHLSLGPSQLLPGQSAFLNGLSTVNISTPMVAFAAGVAGMLAFETRAASAVGVAISVTTIPASAYLGVATGLGTVSKDPSALAVLGINVSMLLLAGWLTLSVQRVLARRAAAVG